MNKEYLKRKFVNYIKEFLNDGRGGKPINGCCLYLDKGKAYYYGDQPDICIYDLKLGISKGLISFKEIENIHNIMVPNCTHGLIFLDALLNDNQVIYEKVKEFYDNDDPYHPESILLGSPVYQRIIMKHFENLQEGISYVE